MKKIDSTLINQIEWYCWRYQKGAHRAGRGTQYRTYKEISKRFKIKYFHINSIVESSNILVLLGGDPFDPDTIKRGDYRVECEKKPERS